MRITGVIAITLSGLLVILGACTSAPAVAPAPMNSTPPRTTPTLAPKPAAFTTSNLVIKPHTVEAANQIDIGVTVTNTGGEKGTYTVVLKIDGAITKTQDVTLTGGTSERIVFTIPILSWFSKHVATIDQLTAELEPPDLDEQ